MNDPVFWDREESETTIIRLPTPGHRVPKERVEAAIVPQLVRTAVLPVEAMRLDLRNPLIAAAYTLFSLVMRIRRTATHGDPGGLRTQLVRQVQNFETAARGQGVAQDRVVAARYALCSLIDEAVLSTPWGHNSVWSTHGLLVTFHQEVFGGEKFFRLLRRILPDPGNNRDLLEFLYTCLALGFEGRFRLVAGGGAQLDELRERVGQALLRIDGQSEGDLSPHWRGVEELHRPFTAGWPLWALLAALGAGLVGAYLWISADLNERSDLQFQALHALRSDHLLPKRAPAEISKVAPRVKVKGLSGFLAPEISARLVTVEELPDRSTVRISGDNLFASGSATINAAYHPVLVRIAEALNDVQGQVLVTGHTDDRPIRSLRYPSNWDLSQARASAVLHLLERKLKMPERLSFEGRGDTEPVAPNDIPANRARNRRVEITLMAPVSTGQRP